MSDSSSDLNDEEASRIKDVNIDDLSKTEKIFFNKM